MGGGQWMVVAIVAIVMLYKIVKMGLRHEDRRQVDTQSPDERQMRDEIRMLKERLAVLERIATDGNITLERQIEALRDQRPVRDRLDENLRRDHADNWEG